MDKTFADPVAAHGWETGKALIFGDRRDRPRSISAWRSIDRLEPWIKRAMEAAASAEPASSSAAEWVLDNGYQVQRAMLLVREDLPSGFYARLRSLRSDPCAGEPRVLLLAHDLLQASHFQLSRENVLAYLEGYQAHSALDIAELWAFPTFLRIACIERLVTGFAEAFGAIAAPFRVSESCKQFLQPGESADCVARAIANLAVISNIDWKEIFDEASQVDKQLAKDPAGVFASMDFDTRNACRKSVERLADLSGQGEVEIAETAILLAKAHEALPLSHVGHWLIAEGVIELERSIGIAPSFSQRFSRWLMRRPGGVYAFALFLCGIAGLAIPAFYLGSYDANLIQWIIGIAVAALPVTVLSVTLVNWFVTLTVAPRQLPKLDYSEGIDPAWPTVVVLPVIVGSVTDVASLIMRLESHFLANPDARGYVLLSDPADASSKRVPGDREVEQALREGVKRLNRERGRLFCLLHRERQYNAGEGCWMAWERKRGKLEEFNNFILTGDSTAFPVTAGNHSRLVGTKFVVTADADTRLPSGVVARLAGTLAHPLNRPIFGAKGRIASGYTVLQPRIEIAPHGSNSAFARLFGGDTAVDIYSRAVSDVYQDLIGTGNFVGKGIYDVAAFARSLEARIPENLLLSHDLWEGLHGRTGLVSDIIVYESFPESYAEYVRRWHRWVRGDWQLLPWLFSRVPGPGGSRLENRFTLFDRLRIWDNMRRSLVPPSVLFLLLAGWFILPGSPALWTALALVVPSAWLFTDLVTGVARGRRRGVLTGTLRQFRDHLARWALQITFLLSDTATAIQAIVVTLLRLRKGHRLLEWTSAAQVGKLLARSSARSGQWAATWPSPLIASVIGLCVVIDGHAIGVAAPLLMLWLAAPEIAWWTARPRMRVAESLNLDDRLFLRRVARRSWLYFERFAGPEDHWLPPDNHQEAPVAATAHRTSPTNIGMMALSAISAWKLGQIGGPEFAGRMQAMLDALDRFELWHGHILNWYNTRDLNPLEPRYVSTVDSGNLAVSLIVLASACRCVANSPIFGDQRWKGLEDCLQLLRGGLEDSGVDGSLLARVDNILDQVAARSNDPATWAGLAEFARHHIALIRTDLVEQLKGSGHIQPELLEIVHDWLERSEHHVEQCLMELNEITGPAAKSLKADFRKIADRARAMAEAMDFSPLYDLHRKLFHIGYDVTAKRIDPHFYDLLASEARLASYFAIAKRDVSPEHWFHLGRPIVKDKRELSLVSWNGSMFEYLMPSLFLRSDPATLLGETETAAVAIQKRYADQHNVPWGISESGFASHGSDGAWRYRAFGVPSLGLRRGLEEDIVIAPYATALALAAAPHEAVQNLRRLAQNGALGRFGFHEALDFTAGRANGRQIPLLVKSYMAHHHGMTIAAIANALDDDAIVKWFHVDQRMESVDLLLNERIPWELPAELERLEQPVATPATRAPLPQPEPWEVTLGEAPMTVLLGNGRLSLTLASDGCGDLAWKGNLVSCPCGPNRDRGHFLYTREKVMNKVWSSTLVPLGNKTDDRRIIVHPHKLEFRCRKDAISSTLDILVSPSQDVEIRRLRLINDSAQERLVEVASHVELALAEAGEWSRHPAFARLFVEQKIFPEIDTLLFARRARSPAIPGLVMAQRLIGTRGSVQFGKCETSRRITRGRLGDTTEFPRFTDNAEESRRFPLDPVAAFVAEVGLQPYGEAEIAVVTTLAPIEHEALELVRRFGSLASLDWAEQDAADSIRHEIQFLGLDSHRLREAQMLFSALTAPSGPRNPSPSDAAREDLWALGLSGDYPVLLVELGEQFSSEQLRFALAAHQLWRRKGAQIDLALLHPGLPGYAEPLRERIYDILRDCGCEDQLGSRGGIILAGSEQNNSRIISALRKTASVSISADGSKDVHILQPATDRAPVPLFVATAPCHRDAAASARAADTSVMAIANGIGGFNFTGDYVIDLDGASPTPAPWANVLANRSFGSIVTEAGLGFSFAGNSGENRLTPWHNDALMDPQAEALYLRDEETGEVWSVTPLPAGGENHCQVVHAPGETRWQRQSKDLEQQLCCFVAGDDPIKIVSLNLRNDADKARRITVTYFADWLLGTSAGEPAPFRASWYRADLGALLGHNRWQAEYRDKIAFLAGTGVVHSLTTSRSDFLGRLPNWKRPAGLTAWGLGERSANEGADAAAAIQLHLDIAAGAEAEAAFILGEVSSEDEVAPMLERWRAPGTIEAERQRVTTGWQARCDALQVQTPDPALDVMVNRWLPYQTMSSRLFARAGYYQASGAFGFRDQLQDVLALLLSAPELAREHILEAASHQFEEGDVLHWWHPPSGKGVRTRYSDDLLWLPYAVARYVSGTGDRTILDVPIPFLAANELAADEHDRFGTFAHGTDASLYEHCVRAFDRAWRLGAHELPLMGEGDWNDGMNRVGSGGKGESVWLAWFLATTIRDFASICEKRGDRNFAMRWLPRREQLIKAAERHAWDGNWYIRAFDDLGRPWGSHTNDECRIDALVQSWAVMAGADETKAKQAIDSAFEHLVSPDDRIARLLTPPFDQTPRDPGYIKAYPPGIRENGGQYSHASAWLGIACAMLGDGARAKAIFDRINPACQADSPTHAAIYATEPYAVAADIGGDEHLGRGGWSWYTGAAGWAWRLATEHILGIRLENGSISLNPCLPPDWPGFSATIKGHGNIEIEVTRGPDAQCLVDGSPARPSVIRFPGAGRTSRVKLVLAQAQPTSIAPHMSTAT